MRSSRFNDEKIIGMIKDQEAGMPTADVCRKHPIISFIAAKQLQGGQLAFELRVSLEKALHHVEKALIGGGLRGDLCA